MAKVSLRSYIREIEGLVEQGRIDEAIAHCRHILTTFPKHLEAYRLLGKAYLESRRYAEAVDIFGRVLMAVPDDFVSHVGLSIIRDEENKLDDSIWHMERAFEAQPSNAAIQGELQRLYGRRDGMEPPKIRMTRGALAHMYVQGELYPQAIAEIRSVLAQDPQRSDMQILLAFSYFKSGQKSDASDICTQLLKRYPYCYDANRIMVDLIAATAAAAETTQVYRMRVGELDPYGIFVKGSVFQIHEVPDASVNLERLEYTGEAMPSGREWSSSLGAGFDSSAAPSLSASSSDDQPDWLKSSGFADEAPVSMDTFQSMPEPASASSQANEEIPDFLRAAGWGESNTPEQPTSIFDEEPAGELIPADLPDWLKGQAPVSDDLARITQPRSDVAEPMETPDWLSGLGEASVAEASFETPQAQPSGDVPDWLSGLGGAAQTSESQAQPSGDVPDWLSGLGDAQTSEPQAQPSSDVPDWLSGLGDTQSSNEIAQSADIPDWMGRVDNSQADAQPADVPDWLRAAEPKSEPAPSVESLGASAQEQDDAVAWLESLAAKHGAKPEELVTDPNKRNEKPPEWVAQAQSIGQQASAPQPNVQDLGASAQEQDDAVAWLESLAAKHGAKPEELVTDPNKRSETPPEWVAQAQSIGQQASAPQPNVQDLGASAQEQDDAVAWLESLAAKHGAKPEELVTDPNKRSETPPEWVQQAQSIGEAQAAPIEEPAKKEWVEGAQNIGEQFFAEFETASTAEPVMDETGMWLRDLDDKGKQADHTKEEGLQRGDIPDWLSDTQQPANADDQFAFPEQQPSAQNADLPNWLSGLDEEAPVKETSFADQSLNNNDLSNWLSGLDDEPGLDFDPEFIRASARGANSAQPEKPIDTQSAKSDLPDWLGGMDSEQEAEDESWKQPAASTPTEEPAAPSLQTPVTLTADLPDWLQGETEEAGDEGDDAAPWLHRERWEAEGTPQQPKPTAPSDWHPLAEKPAQSSTQKAAPTPKTKQVSAQARTQQVMQTPPPPQPSESVAAPVAKKKAASLPRQPKVEGQSNVNALNQAKGELDRGDIPAALDHYSKLIKKGKHLEETIRDLTESIYRYPVEVGIWQTLGDAYMRANRLKEALESYNKAEELIR